MEKKKKEKKTNKTKKEQTPSVRLRPISASWPKSNRPKSSILDTSPPPGPRQSGFVRLRPMVDLRPVRLRPVLGVHIFIGRLSCVVLCCVQLCCVVLGCVGGVCRWSVCSRLSCVQDLGAPPDRRTPSPSYGPPKILLFPSPATISLFLPLLRVIHFGGDLKAGEMCTFGLSCSKLTVNT